MAKIDIVKAKITFLQIFMVVLIGAGFTLVGWIAQNENSKLLILAVLTVIVISWLLIFLVKTILKKIHSLGDL